MEINNRIYDELADSWWDGGSFLSMLHALNPGRFDYLDSILTGLDANPETLTALEVGCGGGYATEKLARMGFTTCGLDPSEASIEAARKHAKASGLKITYKTGIGEDIPWHTGSFDVVFCCDVLEHVTELDLVIKEISRVLKPGGIFFFDTINRTPLSWAFFIKLAQDLPVTRFMPRNTHVWDMFIKPHELKAELADAGLQCREITGLAPSTDPRKVLAGLNALRKGEHPEQVGRKIGMGKSWLTAGSYMGWATKT